MPAAGTSEKRLAGSRPGVGVDPLQNKKTAIVTLRWLLVIAAAYLMLFTGHTAHPLGVAAIVVLMLACNVAIGRLPESVVTRSGFDVAVLVVDTLLLSSGLYLTDAISSDFYLLYFFVIFLAGASEKLASVLLGSLLASVAYVSIVSMRSGVVPADVLLPKDLALRLFFIFAVALFYGVLVERVRRERERRQIEYVTTLEGVNARLRELVELKQSFLSAVSHELRTPLNALLGYLDLLRDGTIGDLSEAVRDYVDKAYRRAQHLTRLIENLLSFANVSRGRTEIHSTDTEVAAVLEKIRETVMPAAIAKGLALEVEVAPDVGWVVIDGGKLFQILLHLATNAVKFTERGEVRITVARRASAVETATDVHILECSVSDTGPGIPAEQQEIIFEDFRQLDGSTTRKHSGMGLGLSLCRALVHLLRGELRVDSCVGAGSTFTARLPVESRAPSAAYRTSASGVTVNREPPTAALRIVA